MADNRFDVISQEGGVFSDAAVRTVIRDRETGVCYLWVTNGSAGGLTVMLDREGRPLTSSAVKSV